MESSGEKGMRYTQKITVYKLKIEFTSSVENLKVKPVPRINR